MKTKQKAEMYNAIHAHGVNLNTIFNTGLEPVELCKKLRRLERKAEQLTTDECNTGNDHSGELETIRQKVCRILNATAEQSNAIFVNGDPRGHALKIRDTFVQAHNLKLHQDWGGYGILAPDFTPNN